MKKIFRKINRRCLNLAILAVLLLPDIVSAQYFTYAPGDLVAGFRKPGVGTYELVANVGNVSNFLVQPIGTVITLSPTATFFPTQLSDAFSSFTNLQWSVSASFGSGTWDGFAQNTIWYTLPRANPSVQTTPPSRYYIYTQSPIKLVIVNDIEFGANDIGSHLGATNQDNNTYLVREPENGPYNGENYGTYIEDPNNIYLATYGGILGYTVENTTPTPFTSGVASVSDLYQSVPVGSVDPNTGTTNGVAYYVGYFTLNYDGSMTFTRAVRQPPAPQITSITRTNGTTTVYFTTASSATYTLYYTNSAGLTTSVTNWPSSPTTLTGDGGTDYLTDAAATATNRFYRVGAHY